MGTHRSPAQGNHTTAGTSGAVALSTQYSAPEDMLIAESQWARLIVLAVRGTGDRVENGPGTVALAVSRHGDCPVVVVRSRAPNAPPPHAGPVGSVSQSLLHYAECPIAVARPHQLDHARPARFRTVSTRVGR